MERKHPSHFADSGTAPPAGIAGASGVASQTAASAAAAPFLREARFGIGEVVRHRIFPFRGVVFDVDPEFSNTDEWWEAIPEDVRPAKDQPFYHLLAENDDGSYVAYVSQQNLEADGDGEEIRHPAIPQIFESFRGGRYILRPDSRN